MKCQKGEKASKDKSKSETSPEQKAEVETVENGNACAESNNNVISNGSDCTDDEGMDHSPSAENMESKTENCGDQKDGIQEADSVMQIEGGSEVKKPPKKKREDDADSDGEKEGKNICNKSTSQHTPLKTSKTSLLSGREEKIPRTEYDLTTEKDEVIEMSQESVPAINGSAVSGKTAEEQANGKESEPMDTDSSPSNRDKASTDLEISSKNEIEGTNKSK